MDIDAGPIFVQLQSQAPAQIQPLFALLAELYDKKHWHEFSVNIDKLFKDPLGSSLILPIYRQLILPLSKRLSPDAFVRFSVLAAAHLGNPAEAIEMLLNLSGQFSKTSPDQTHLFVYARMSAAYYQINTGAIADAKGAIEECLPFVEAFVGVDASIKAVFYRVRSEFDKVKALFAAYYRDAFLYLACVNFEELSAQERLEQAHDLCVAALSGETIFNFGELLMHPILETLKGTQFEYLHATLHAFNNGDHEKLEALLPALQSNAILAPRLAFLRQKMCLMALVECVFAAMKSSRRIPFSTISAASQVPIAEVEFLLMKALSVGILRGTIDQPEQIISVDWVQPRVLDREQLVQLRSSIQTWKARIQGISANIDLASSLPILQEELLQQ